MRILTMSRQLRTLNFRQATPLLYNAYAHWMSIYVVIFNLNKKQNTPLPP